MNAHAFELVTVTSGARSLRCRQSGETFHPVVGPMIEARALHVREPRLVARAGATAGDFIIWDVGLGAAANAIAILEGFAGALPDGARRVELHSFEETTSALEFALAHAGELEYLAPYEQALAELIGSEDHCTRVADSVHWKLHCGDFRELIQTVELAPPHAIIYDPYSPKANPGMWSLEHFVRLRACLRDTAPCLLTNYTRSTAVRVTLLLAGFFVGRGAAVGEKDQTTVASNCLGLLSDPLEKAWLERVRFSTRGAPLREGAAPGPVSAADFQALERHPQFAE